MTEPADSAFEFEGRWQSYAPIAFTNLLLTIVTQGPDPALSVVAHPFHR